MMSNRTRFALHGLCFLASRPANAPTSFREVLDYLRSWSSDSALSSGYIGKLFQTLSRAGIVRAVPGRKGGYRLARPAKSISVVEVFRALEGSPAGDECPLAIGSCSVKHPCGIISLARDAELAFFAVLEKESLESMARRMIFPKAQSLLPIRRAGRT